MWNRAYKGAELEILARLAALEGAHRGWEAGSGRALDEYPPFSGRVHMQRSMTVVQLGEDIAYAIPRSHSNGVFSAHMMCHGMPVCSVMQYGNGQYALLWYNAAERYGKHLPELLSRKLGQAFDLVVKDIAEKFPRIEDNRG